MRVHQAYQPDIRRSRSADTTQRPQRRTLFPTVALGMLLALSACNKSDAPPPGVAQGKPVTGDEQVAMGETLFNKNCARCHGNAAAGSDHGPPLVHKIYEPNHHPNEAFYRAAATGVRAHHWKFGNMPKVGGVNTSDMTVIIAYVRKLQRDAGIY